MYYLNHDLYDRMMHRNITDLSCPISQMVKMQKSVEAKLIHVVFYFYFGCCRHILVRIVANFLIFRQLKALLVLLTF